MNRTAPWGWNYPCNRPQTFRELMAQRFVYGPLRLLARLSLWSCEPGCVLTSGHFQWPFITKRQAAREVQVVLRKEIAASNVLSAGLLAVAVAEAEQRGYTAGWEGLYNHLIDTLANHAKERTASEQRQEEEARQ